MTVTKQHLWCMILGITPPSSAFKADSLDPKDEYCQGIDLSQYRKDI